MGRALSALIALAKEVGGVGSHQADSTRGLGRVMLMGKPACYRLPCQHNMPFSSHLFALSTSILHRTVVQGGFRASGDEGASMRGTELSVGGALRHALVSVLRR